MSRYAKRERAWSYMAWVKTQECIVRTFNAGLFMTPCNGAIEADHMGERGLGRKALDRTCVSMCASHHRQRTDMTGAFKDVTKSEMRLFAELAINLMHRRAWAQGIEIPNV